MTLRAGVLAGKRYAWMLPHHTGGVPAGTCHRERPCGFSYVAGNRRAPPAP
ncbi:hypothetical protein C7S15_7272 [Burkholderia cepacia]|nr:hypothetical protein [Burkholderia cepacia]